MMNTTVINENEYIKYFYFFQNIYLVSNCSELISLDTLVKEFTFTSASRIYIHMCTCASWYLQSFSQWKKSIKHWNKKWNETSPKVRRSINIRNAPCVYDFCVAVIKTLNRNYLKEGSQFYNLFVMCRRLEVAQSRKYTNMPADLDGTIAGLL